MAQRPLNETFDSISFAGCAWLITYHLGVAQALKESLDTTSMKFLGASSGALTALMLAAEIDLHDALDFACAMATDSRKRLLGPVGRMHKYVTAGLTELLPEDAYRKVFGRMLVSVTELPLMRNRILPEVAPESNRELIGIILASSYIPLYYERPALLNGRAYIDGGVTDNCPRLDDRTIIVSPKSAFYRKGKATIGPEVEPRFMHAFFPEAKAMKELFDQGRRDWESFMETPWAKAS